MRLLFSMQLVSLQTANSLGHSASKRQRQSDKTSTFRGSPRQSQKQEQAPTSRQAGSGQLPLLQHISTLESEFNKSVKEIHWLACVSEIAAQLTGRTSPGRHFMKLDILQKQTHHSLEKLCSAQSMDCGPLVAAAALTLARPLITVREIHSWQASWLTASGV